MVYINNTITAVNILDDTFIISTMNNNIKNIFWILKQYYESKYIITMR